MSASSRNSIPRLSAGAIAQHNLHCPPVNPPPFAAKATPPLVPRKTSHQQQQQQQLFGRACSRDYQEYVSIRRNASTVRAVRHPVRSQTLPPPVDKGHLGADGGETPYKRPTLDTIEDLNDDGSITLEKQTVQQELEIMNANAEEIAVQKFAAVLCLGAGMSVVKHNRGRGRVRRVLKFDVQRNCLVWHAPLPPFSRTSVPRAMLKKTKRTGSFVNLSIADQGDVGFECRRLTDAMILELGLNRIIREKEKVINP